MRYETKTVRIGENMGPVDWDHPMAKDMPLIWREAEQNPDDYTFSDYERSIIAICMYDGWPYWTPTPAVYFYGPLGPEWNHFNSYGVRPDSIRRRRGLAQGTSAGTAETQSGSGRQPAGPVHESGCAKDAPEGTHHG